MKINVGDYVRTKTGIHKIFEINENATVWKYLCDKKPTGEWDGSYEYTTTRDENIIKSAEGTPRGLLNLIEVGDYVNGYLIDYIDSERRFLRSERPYRKYDHTYKALIEKGRDYNQVLHFFAEDIKSIVTKEQFEAMQYVIKED